MYIESLPLPMACLRRLSPDSDVMILFYSTPCTSQGQKCPAERRTGKSKSATGAGPSALSLVSSFYWAFLTLASFLSRLFFDASAPASVSKSKSHHLKLLE